MLIQRESYINQLKPFISKPLVKVLTGIRRCGKSSILMMITDELLSMGIEENHIIHINFESMNYSDLNNAKALYLYIKEQIRDKEKYYLLLDEIQEVEAWEKAVNSFMVDFNIDIYLTGSNSNLLSSELATYLTGRYIEIHVFPLSFSEFLLFRQKHQFNQNLSTHQQFESFIRLGGFPVISSFDYTLDEAYRIVFDIYSSAILRDTVQRHNIRNVELLERIVKFVFDNIGNTFSAKSIADYFKSQQRKVDLNTVYNYLAALEDAFIIQRIQRYDLKGREILKTLEKYFVCDPSLKYAVMGFKDRDIAGILENIVLFELLRRGYQVYIGKLNNLEIDFVGEKNGAKLYIQIAYRLSSQETIDREFQPLLKIDDHYPKYVLTLEEFWQDNIAGVKHMHIADFLLDHTY